MPLKSTLDRFHALPDNLKGSFVLIGATGVFALMTVLIKLLGQNLHITQILFVRQIVITSIVLPSVLKGFPGVLRTRNPYLQLLRVALALTAMMMGFTAVIHLPLAEATALGFAKSFFVTIFAILILRETVGLRRWMAVVIGFVGVGIMLRPGTESFSIYGAMSIGGAACAGAVMVIIRLMSRHDAPTTILGWQAIGVGIAISVPALWFWKWPTMTEWLLLAAMGLTAYAAQMGNILAFKWGEASLLASLDYIRLIYATLLGWLIFETLPNRYTLIGAAIIVLASIYTVLRERRRKQVLTRSPHGRDIAG